MTGTGGAAATPAATGTGGDRRATGLLARLADAGFVVPRRASDTFDVAGDLRHLEVARLALGAVAPRHRGGAAPAHVKAS
ncbi:MAG: hypothetical protein S0880_33735, partial [Actinomycetota bacterium]|nr:hypothetical protein [Actinomycetota bacterium]